jgi:hypothetical protein
VRADGLNGIQVGDFRMTRGDTLLLGIDRLRVRYRLASLLTGRFISARSSWKAVRGRRTCSGLAPPERPPSPQSR